MIAIDAQRLLGRIRELGAVGRDGEDRLIRLAASDTDRQGRDLFVGWLRQAGLDVAIDRVGNIFGIWQSPDNREQAPLLIGSHIDTVIDAGIYDGCYGVLAGLEVIETLKATGFSPSRPIVVAAFTNEEGVRYTPDMMGSLVHAGGIDAETVLAAVGTDGSVLGQELARIGYAGDREPGFLKPHAYLELHIEQGPVLEREGLPIGAVENLQGISWQRITIDGVANHAGTTPMLMRNDAGHAAARTITFLLDRAKVSNAPTVATVGTIRFEPNAINVIPSRAVFTIDLRDPDEQRLQAEEAALAAYLEQLATDENVTISVEQLARFEPVIFDLRIVELIEAAAKNRGLGVRRMTSGAGHDAQMLARIAPAAMIFVPSAGGISHSPREHTDDAELVAGANILLDVAAQLAK
ncbi:MULTISPECIES: Zn-dependent hydrolase [unclassified Mesorhizobium]|uniref:Zn-dependent hydrolase n=1 Tax=unclassified Mesorhizobium TaxID=325217 RepID=UPI000FD760E6|nr:MULTISPECIES: Zn-dependent hydrolase [unclassified Mesorhizobium]AZV22776.1 Zn-dependent hydrolase [Mesorhizobium sp. M7A.F.Ce.TU.012.03.2.1]RWO65107.1 MAG: Zn-dependent hydrolase [Mesorhizobium sp.]RWP13643.1 MAG: Zn-dependent hydrolase [Mesorhizobium sp.]RWP76445.1 MAG: Zn-dependent hydrolase [Mesorhizobium sp.]RWQ17046.1 MAG: Zn-dependent hydrolase [Mesorhizobium sp.]